MDSQTPIVPTDKPASPTTQKRTSKSVATGPLKRPTSRSNSKQATDYLLDENRLGIEVHRPHKKRRYIAVYLEKMMASLVTLYSFLFKVHWTHFRHAEQKFPVQTTGQSIFEYFGIVYLTHWLHDLYRINRKCLESLDPVAFAERYYPQVGTYSDIYDNFLSIVASHLRPTHIINNYSDDIYIPLFTTRTVVRTGNVLDFNWSKAYFNHDLFYLILQTFENKKFVKMTPLSSDLLGRPSWLFDWNIDNTVFAWFPQEGNYNDEDVAVAYVIGDTCTPKLGHADYDDWKITSSANIELTNQSILAAYKRVTPRRWFGCAEFRTGESQEINLPLYHEKDEAKFAAANNGPLQIVDNYLSKLTIASSSNEEEPETQVDASTVPPSPRPATRSVTAAAAATTKYHRTRVIDRMYYAQVIRYFDTTSRFTAFKLFVKPE